MLFWHCGIEEHKEIALSVLEKAFENKNHPKHAMIKKILSDYWRPDELAEYNAKVEPHLQARRLEKAETIPCWQQPINYNFW
jgi:hypothetical protein